MTAQELKSHIYINELIENVLYDLGCHHIKKHDGFYTCSNPDGDNKSAIVVYENENLTTLNYTRQLTTQQRTTDIFDLVAFIKQCTFPESIRETCNMLGLDYYQEAEEKPASLQWAKALLVDMPIDKESEDTTPLKPIPEEILSYYMPYGNIMFEQDNISLEVQEEFGIGYDPQSNRITIPIRDALGTLCGVKGRLFGEPDQYNPKYLYIEPVAKNKILYGYYENKNYIKDRDIIFCGEAEKFTLQLASYGYRNAISLGGKSISKTQRELLIRTERRICLSFDKDVDEEELKSIASVFPENISVYAIIDKDNILNSKESPSDDLNKWTQLVNKHIYQIK